jgi:hypothetical protein
MPTAIGLMIRNYGGLWTTTSDRCDLPMGGLRRAAAKLGTGTARRSLAWAGCQVSYLRFRPNLGADVAKRHAALLRWFFFLGFGAARFSRSRTLGSGNPLAGFPRIQGPGSHWSL